MMMFIRLPAEIQPFAHYAWIMISSVCVYTFILLGIRLFGKKELAQLSVLDLVFILLISNAVQNAMVANDGTLLGGLVSAFSLFVTNAVLRFLFLRFPKFGKIVQGQPIMLVYQGKINERNLKKASLTMDELLEATREHGVADIADVDLAILEVDGNISILSDSYRKKSVRRRKSHKAVTKSL